MTNSPRPKLKTSILALCAALLGGCASHPPIATVPKVDLPRFMGSWYVIACIPTFIETKAYNAVESYKLDKDGNVDTTFTFHEGSFDGPVKTYNPRGFVIENTGDAIWGMQFIWPIKAEYRIAYLASDYSSTVIARNSRDYVWIMARKPIIPDSEYQELSALVGKMGYDLSKLRKVPQQWHATPSEVK